MAKESDRERLHRLMDERRLQLRLTWHQVAENGRISYEALRAFRAGQPTIRRLTARGIEAGLQWEAGSVDHVLSGGDPTPEGSAAPAEAAGPFDDLIERIYQSEYVSEERKREIAGLVRQAEAQLKAIEDEVKRPRRTA